MDGEPECLLGPVKVSIRNLVSANDKVYFSSDRDGTQELYSIDTESRKVFQHTSLPYGGDEFCFIGQDVIFSMLTKDGRLLHKAPALEISGKEVDFNDIHQYRVADKLTMQERASAAQKCIPWADSAKDYKTTFSKPERYRKPLNILRFHSWAPLYFNYDRVRNLSGDLTYETASAGATALFQNSLGTAWGSVGYSFHKDPFAGVYKDGSHKYRHSGHILFTYSGLYPVFEFSADFNDNAAIQYSRLLTETRRSCQGTSRGTSSGQAVVPRVPSRSIFFQFLFRRLVPWLLRQISYAGSNDLFNKSLLDLSKNGIFAVPDNLRSIIRERMSTCRRCVLP